MTPTSTRTSLAWALLAVSLLGGCGEMQEEDSATEPLGEYASRDLRSLEDRLYPPALVLDYQAAAGIEEPQLDAILEEVRTTQAELTELDAELRAELETLEGTLEAEAIDEAAALAAADRVMSQERAIKTAHLRMLIRIRNQLTPAQRASLDGLRDAHRAP